MSEDSTDRLFMQEALGLARMGWGLTSPNPMVGAVVVRDGVIKGGMIPKAECCRNAIEWGVRRVFIIDGRVPHAILIEMLTNEGIGTMFTR